MVAQGNDATTRHAMPPNVSEVEISLLNSTCWFELEKVLSHVCVRLLYLVNTLYTSQMPPTLYDTPQFVASILLACLFVTPNATLAQSITLDFVAGWAQRCTIVSYWDVITVSFVCAISERMALAFCTDEEEYLARRKNSLVAVRLYYYIHE